MFGTVVSTTYTYGVGEYNIYLQHGGTLGYYLCGGRADYDYTAHVVQVEGEGSAKVTIKDPDGKIQHNLLKSTEGNKKVCKSC